MKKSCRGKDEIYRASLGQIPNQSHILPSSTFLVNWEKHRRFSLRVKNSLKKKKRFYLFIFIERGRRDKDRESNINVWLPLTGLLLGTQPTTQACAQTGNWTSNVSVHRLALNPLSHTRQGKFNLMFKKEAHMPSKQETPLVVRGMRFPEKIRTFFTPQICKNIRRFISIVRKGCEKTHSHIADDSVNSTSFLEVFWQYWNFKCGESLR